MIVVTCTCGARLKAKDEAAGRRIKCPRCGGKIPVPAGAATPAAAPSGGAEPSPLDLLESLGTTPSAKPAAPVRSARPAPKFDDNDLYGLADGDPIPMAPTPAEAAVIPGGTPASQTGAAAAGVRCPSCQRVLAAGSRICVACGINVQTGRSLMTADDGLDNAYMTAENTIRWLSWLMPLGLYPVASEAFGTRKPYVVRAIAVLTITVSVLFLVALLSRSSMASGMKKLMLWTGESPSADALRAEARAEYSSEDLKDPDVQQEIEEMVRAHQASAGQFHAYQLLTHALLHGGLIHLAGNLLFLMVLGARVNALIGNIWTLIAYPLLAICAGIAQAISTAHQPSMPTLGASGAVMGLAGMYLVLFPVHKVHMAIWIRLGFATGFRLAWKLFAVRGFWMVLFYIAFDVLYTAFGIKDSVAHWAHLGGFIGGIVLALVLLLGRLVNARGADIVSIVLGRRAWALVGKPRMS